MNHLEQLSQQYGIKILPEDELVDEPQEGFRYHLAWAKSRGMNWKFMRMLANGKCKMKTPHTHKKLEADLKDLRHTNKRIVQKAKERIKAHKKSIGMEWRDKTGFECDYCGSTNIEVETTDKSPNMVYDGDKARCKGCKSIGFCAVSEEPYGYIDWDREL